MWVFISVGLLLSLVLNPTNVLAAGGEKGKLAQSYAFERSEVDARRLAATLVEIKIGTPLEEVKRKMGRPDAEATIFKPQILRRNTFLFTRLDYFLKKVELETDNVKDHKISLYFDINAKLFRISEAP